MTTNTTTATAFYIVARSGDQRAELVGPFKRERDASAELESVSELMHAMHPEQSAAATFDVEAVEINRHIGPRRGTKNRVLNYQFDLSGWIALDNLSAKYTA